MGLAIRNKRESVVLQLALRVFESAGAVMRRKNDTHMVLLRRRLEDLNYLEECRGDLGVCRGKPPGLPTKILAVKIRPLLGENPTFRPFSRLLRKMKTEEKYFAEEKSIFS